MSKKQDNCNHDYVCDNCGEPAEYNLQGDGWCLWSIDKNGNFEEEKTWGLGEGDNNEFFCRKCAKEEGII